MQVNAKNTYGITPLHLACQVGNLQGVKLLINHAKIILNVTDGNGDTPLHEACYHGNEEITETLLDKMEERDKLDLTTKNELELTPLHLACREGQTKIVALLLKKCRCNLQSLIMLTDKEGATAVHLACYNDNEDIIKMLLEERVNSPAQMEERINVPTLMVKREKALAEKEDHITPLHLAAKYGCLKVMILLFEGLSEEDVNVRDTYDQTPLHYAAENGKEETLKFLLEKYVPFYSLIFCVHAR